MSEWISIDDRLPAEREHVMCRLHWGGEIVELEGYQQDGTFGDARGGEWIHGLVTHWKPMEASA